LAISLSYIASNPSSPSAAAQLTRRGVSSDPSPRRRCERRTSVTSTSWASGAWCRTAAAAPSPSSPTTTWTWSLARAPLRSRPVRTQPQPTTLDLNPVLHQRRLGFLEYRPMRCVRGGTRDRPDVARGGGVARAQAGVLGRDGCVLGGSI
jgi:hypothetical protein